MVITKNILVIMKLFVTDPDKEYNISEIAKKTKINYRLAYETVIALEKQKILQIKTVGNTRLCRLVSGACIPLYAYAEAERAREFLEKHVSIKIIKDELEKKKRTVYDSVIVFGSYVKGIQSKKSDIDLLFIIPSQIKKEVYEQEIQTILQLLDYKIDINILTEKEFVEVKKEQALNIVQEVISNHIILGGAEQFHYLLAK